MNIDDDLRPSLFESLNWALAVAGVVTLGVIGRPVVRFVCAAQNKVFDAALAAGERYVIVRWHLSTLRGFAEADYSRFMGSIFGSSGRCG